MFQHYAAHVYADDIWDKRVPDAEAAAHAKVGLGVDVEGGGGGGVVVVRPDGHVGCVVRLVEGKGTVEALEEYFAGFVVGGKGMRRHEDGEGGKGVKKLGRKSGGRARARL